MKYTLENISRLLNELNQIGIALSAEKDQTRLLELILIQAMDLSDADGGTLYLRNEHNRLEFVIMHNRSLNLHKGGTSGVKIDLPPVPLMDQHGHPNNNLVVTWAALNGKTANIADVYGDDIAFDFSGTRQFDKKLGYHSTSFLTVPMVNHENEIIGVLQLINATDEKTGQTIAFSPLVQQLVESLASQAAVTITNKTLIDAQKNLFDSFIQLIANAIDEKSPYTAGHCRRVPIITNMLADAACRTKTGPLADFYMTEAEKYELEVAAWLHDCGKITTPEYVVDKSTKLETIFDRIHLVDTRFEILKRDKIIDALLTKLGFERDLDAFINSDEALRQQIKSLASDREYVHQCNIGGESMSEQDRSKIEQIATEKWHNGNNTVPLLSDEEVRNLKIERGTLTIAEREIINNHVSVTIKMLEALPYPKHLRRVPEYAGGHHEKIDGTGYPNKLTGTQMSIPARIVAIADIFEALTAADRPYKKAMPLSQSLKILARMKRDNHIDPDLFDVFIKEKVYMEYAEKYLKQEQLDEVDHEDISGAPLLQ